MVTRTISTGASLCWRLGKAQPTGARETGALLQWDVFHQHIAVLRESFEEVPGRCSQQGNVRFCISEAPRKHCGDEHNDEIFRGGHTAIKRWAVAGAEQGAWRTWQTPSLSFCFMTLCHRRLTILNATTFPEQSSRSRHLRKIRQTALVDARKSYIHERKLLVESHMHQYGIECPWNQPFSASASASRYYWRIDNLTGT